MNSKGTKQMVTMAMQAGVKTILFTHGCIEGEVLDTDWRPGRVTI